MRRLYDWVLHWAETRFAIPALFCLAFAESSFFPIPPDVLLIALCIGDTKKSYRFATWCSLGSVFGGIAGYGIGLFVWEQVQGFCYAYLFSAASVATVSGLYDRWDFWIVFVAAFTPIPYKVCTIMAGVCAINFPMFVLASAVGRSARFFLVAWLFRHYGPPIKDFIERRFALVTLGGAVLLVGGFVAIKYLDYAAA
jgi:membrane protein YqaA with SNARE-associated domain